MTDDFEYQYDDEENKQYLDYLKYRAEEFQDESEREEFFKELQEIRFNPSNNPRQDAELNYRRAKDRLRQKRKANKLPDAAQSFVKFKMQEDNLDEKQARKWIKKVMKEGE